MSTHKPALEIPLGRAWAYHRDGRNDQALAEFSQILNQSPNDIDARFGLGLVQKALGRTDEALASFEVVKQLIHDHEADITEDESNRFEMLLRMCEQRIAELTGAVSHIDVTQTRRRVSTSETPAIPRTAGTTPSPRAAVYSGEGSASAPAEAPVRPLVDFPSRTEIIGLIGLLFGLVVSIESITTVNGVVTSYSDLADVIGGAVAVIAGLMTVRVLGDTRPDDRVKRYIAIAVLVLLGAFLVLRGLGVILP